jgi:DNA polymerase
MELSALREPVSSPARLLPPPPEVVLPAGDKAARWEALREQVLDHPVCRAHVRPGRKVVFGVGNLGARIMFVGEAPGAEEEQQGEPFVGPAGQLLTKMIKAMGLDRGDVYIGNIMNWRPELPARGDGTQVGNREPTPEEMAFCLPFITAQIEVISPVLIVALGATATRGLLGPHSFRTLGDVRGRWHDYRGRPLRVTYHPSYLLRKEAEGRSAANRAKRTVWEDFLAVMERAGIPITDKQRNYFL